MKRQDHFIRLNADARSDIQWWCKFAEPWNSISLLSTWSPQPPEITIFSDASGSWGCGATWEQRWIQLKWARMLEGSHISMKELTPIVIAAAVWGPQWKGKSVRAFADNTAAVAAINNQTSHIREMAHMLRCLAFITARFQFSLRAVHIPGEDNSIADAVSRNNMPLFRSLCPQANEMPTPIPSSLLEILLLEMPDWTSQKWSRLWTDIFQLV